MQNRKILALCLAGLMTVQLSAVAFADGDTITEAVSVVEKNDGTVLVSPSENPPIIEVSGTTVTINASVESNPQSVAVWATGDTTVNVNGSVTGSNYGVEAETGSTVTVGDSVTGTDKTGVYASNGTVTVDGSVTGGECGVAAETGSTVTVNGDVSGSSFIGVYADNAEITVDGSVTGGKNGVEAYRGSSVTVEGSVTGKNNTGVDATGESTVTVDGSVTGGDVGARVGASENGVGKLTVTGDVSGRSYAGVIAGSKTETSVNGSVTGGKYGVEVGGGTVTVGGSVTGGENGVGAYSGSTVTVDGSVTGGTNGVEAEDSTVTVDGDVTGTNGAGIFLMDGADVYIYGDVTGTTDAVLVETTATSVDTLKIPTIVVQTLVAANLVDVQAEDGVLDPVVQQAMVDAVAKQIEYIVTSEGVTVTGTTGTHDGYETAKESETLTVTGDVDESASFGRYAQWVHNEDGSYTVTVMRGGDLVFKAKVYQSESSAPVVQEVYYGPAIRATGDQASAEQPDVQLGVRASHFLKVVMDGTEVDPSEYVAAAESHGLLTFRFAPEFISALKAGVYKLQVKTTDCTFNLVLTVNEDGTYTVSL